MKKIIFAIVMMLCMGNVMAQKGPVDQKYLAGAVPVIDNHVVFSQTIEVSNGLSADSLYRKAMRWVGNFYKGDDVISRKSLQSQPENHFFSVGINENLYFKRKALVTDWTTAIYELDIKISGNKVSVSMQNLSFTYENQHFAAEQYITDEIALKKDGKSFFRNYGKFRTKSIDRFEEICDSLHLFLIK